MHITIYTAVAGFLLALFACMPPAAHAVEEKQLDGVWAFDADATIALMEQAGSLPAPEAIIREQLENTHITIDTLRKVFIVADSGKEKENNPIVMVSERDGVITLHRRRQADEQYRFIEGGRLMGIENGAPAFVLKRVE